MFRNLARLITPASVFDIHPLQLSRWLDEAWSAAATVPDFGTGNTDVPFHGSPEIVQVIELPVPFGGAQPIRPSGIIDTLPNRFGGGTGPVGPGLLWDHLIYAYLVESTGVLEVMAEVVRRYAVGETLSPLGPPAMRWLRSTEELFFRDPPLYSIQGVVSEMRPDNRIARRNAYWRMFGLEPPHPIPTRWTRHGMPDAAWKLDVGDGVNHSFREKWTELLRQVWLGRENANNGIGPNASDREYIALLCVALRDMMAMRRRGGLLAREEFAYVSTLSWFHLSLAQGSPIVDDLDATGPGPAERLEKIAARVGMSPAPRSRELFELADLMSPLLLAIEVNVFSTGTDAELLFLNQGTNQTVLENMNRIIDLWQSATGDRVKDRPSGASAQPVRLPSSSGGQASPIDVRALAPAAPPSPPAALAGQNGRG